MKQMNAHPVSPDLPAREPDPVSTDRALEAVVLHTLKLGTRLSATLILIGLALAVSRGDWGYPGNGYPVLPHVALAGAAELRPGAFTALGFMLLIATPIVRVAATSLIYWWSGERRLFWVSATVFVVLLLGIWLGVANR